MNKLFVLAIMPIMMMCERGGSDAVDRYDPPPRTARSESKVSSSTSTMLKKELTVEINSKDLDEDQQKLAKLLDDYTVEMLNENRLNEVERLIYFVKLKIKSEQLDAFSQQLEDKFDIRNKRLQAEDVSEEYVDITTRLETKREFLQRYKQLLKQTKSVSEILEIEREIKKLQEEIESAEGRIQFLNDRVSMSRVSISITEDLLAAQAAEVGFGQKIREALSAGWHLLNDSVFFFLSIWPILIILTIVLILIRVRKKKKANRFRK